MGLHSIAAVAVVAKTVAGSSSDDRIRVHHLDQSFKAGKKRRRFRMQIDQHIKMRKMLDHMIDDDRGLTRQGRRAAAMRDKTELGVGPQPLIQLGRLEDLPAAYREEVRITYLHELGHYLGWDEDEVAERGLE